MSSYVFLGEDGVEDDSSQGNHPEADGGGIYEAEDWGHFPGASAYDDNLQKDKEGWKFHADLYIRWDAMGDQMNGWVIGLQY